MSLWIKICANTSLEDAMLVAEGNADAVGFVFATSPRRVTPGQVAAIVPHLPGELEKIGVFVDAALEEIEATVQTSGLTGVQLHFDAEPALSSRLRQRFAPPFRILRVIHFAPETAEAPSAVLEDPSIDAILVDSRTATAVGGTGQSFDWLAASTTLFQNTHGPKLVAAGGLNPANVTEAIVTLRPWGVDVVSGVEAAPGRKDPTKVRTFIANARAAFLP
jgi:phosphoribosylanthranilate isomerase